jgi:hypothetical protein
VAQKAKDLEEKLVELAKAHQTNPSSFNEALDRLYPEDPEEKPEFWRKGEPAPSWAQDPNTPDS